MDRQIEVFRTSGTWRKPPGAGWIDVILVGAQSSDGTPGETVWRSFAAEDVEDVLEVAIGKGAHVSGTAAAGAVPSGGGTAAVIARNGTGADGLAIVITWLDTALRV